MSSNGAEIHRLETQLQSEPNNLNVICQLADFHVIDGKLNKASPLVLRGIDLYKAVQLSAVQGVKILDTSLNLWKADKYANKNGLRINCSNERKRLATHILDISVIIKRLRDLKINQQQLNLKIAYMKEIQGSFQDALTIFSELISEQATDVDLSYVIFKAAVLLKQIGENKQAIEYLEFLQDDPPVTQGITKLHVVAFLILVYERAGEKYKVFLPGCYKSLNTICTTTLTTPGSSNGSGGGNESKTTKRLRDLVTNANVMDSSELWEVLAIQAMDRCEYTLAIQFFLQALLKAGNTGNSNNTGPLLHWLVEIYYLLNDLETANKYAEKAFLLLPNNSDLRNILIQISPEKWTEKLRSLNAVNDSNKNNNNSMSISMSKNKQTTSNATGSTMLKGLLDGNESELDVEAVPKKKKAYHPKENATKEKEDKEKDKEKEKEKGKEKDQNKKKEKTHSKSIHSSNNKAADKQQQQGKANTNTKNTTNDTNANDGNNENDEVNKKEELQENNKEDSTTNNEKEEVKKSPNRSSSSSFLASFTTTNNSASNRPGSASINASNNNNNEGQQQQGETMNSDSKKPSSASWVTRLKATASTALESFTNKPSTRSSLSPPAIRPTSASSRQNNSNNDQEKDSPQRRPSTISDGEINKESPSKSPVSSPVVERNKNKKSSNVVTTAQDSSQLKTSSSSKLSKPTKPLTADEKKYLHFALMGNTNIHYYDETLQALCNIELSILKEKALAKRDAAAGIKATSTSTSAPSSPTKSKPAATTAATVTTKKKKK